MSWEFIETIIKGTSLIATFVGAITIIVELFFSPIRKILKTRKERKEREQRIEQSLEKLDVHLEESKEQEASALKWQSDVEETLKNVNKMLEHHQDAIHDSKNERRVIWRAQRATLDGLKQLKANGLVTQAIVEMDNFVDENMR